MLTSKKLNEKSVQRSGSLLRIVYLLAKISIVVIIVSSALLAIYKAISIKQLNIYNPLEKSELYKYDKNADKIIKTLIIIEKRNEKEGTNEIVYCSLLVRNEENGSQLIFYIPPWVYTGENKIKNLNYFGTNSSFGKGYTDLADELSNLFGLNLNRIIAIDYDSLISSDFITPILGANYNRKVNEFENTIKKQEESAVNDEEIVDLLRFITEKSTNPFYFIFDKSNIRYYENIASNMETSEIILLMKSIRSSLNSIVLVNVGAKNGDSIGKYLIEKVDPAGRFIFEINLDEIDSIIAKNPDIFKYDQIKKEQARVEVYNASSHSGMAKYYSRAVKNLGLNLIRSGNAPETYERTTIFVSDQNRFAESLKIVENLFIIDVEITTERPKFMNTGDIVVIIGENLKEQ